MCARDSALALWIDRSQAVQRKAWSAAQKTLAWDAHSTQAPATIVAQSMFWRDWIGVALIGKARGGKRDTELLQFPTLSVVSGPSLPLASVLSLVSCSCLARLVIGCGEADAASDEQQAAYPFVYAYAHGYILHSHAYNTWRTSGYRDVRKHCVSYNTGTFTGVATKLWASSRVITSIQAIL